MRARVRLNGKGEWCARGSEGRSLARVGGIRDRKKTTMRGNRAAPVVHYFYGAVPGERAGPDAAGWLRQRALNERSPGARRMVGLQSTVDSVR
jgi:hypothetical protein